MSADFRLTSVLLRVAWIDGRIAIPRVLTAQAKARNMPLVFYQLFIADVLRNRLRRMYIRDAGHNALPPATSGRP